MKIRRLIHGTGRRINLSSAVKCATNGERYELRIQSATNIQGKKMRRRAEFLLKHAVRQAD